MDQRMKAKVILMAMRRERTSQSGEKVAGYIPLESAIKERRSAKEGILGKCQNMPKPLSKRDVQKKALKGPCTRKD